MDYEVSATHRGGEAWEAHKRELARLRELEQKVEQKIEPNQIQPPVQKKQSRGISMGSLIGRGAGTVGFEFMRRARLLHRRIGIHPDSQIMKQVKSPAARL